MNQAERVREFDGIRGIAILLVLFFHFSLPDYSSVSQNLVRQVCLIGWSGVDLFFVLSGFLITGILLDSRGAGNYFSVFYARRCLRILPLYYVFLLASFYALRISTSEQIGLLLHYSNWTSAFHPFVLLNHIWSLAVEEQFYLVWPMVVLFCPARRLLPLCLSVMAICLVARNLPSMQALGVEYPDSLYRLTPFRVDSLLFGACGALIVRQPRLAAAGARFLKLPVIAGCAVVIAVVAAAGAGPHSAPMTRFGYSALGLIFTPVVLYAYWNAGSNSIIARILRHPVLMSFGRYSYAIYLIHPYMRLVRIELPSDVASTCLTLLLRIGGSYLAAMLSWILLEQHFWKLKSRFRYQRGDRVDKQSAEVLQFAG